MKFRVACTSQDTGNDVEIIITAKDRKQAIDLACKMNFIVEDVEAVPSIAYKHSDMGCLAALIALFGILFTVGGFIGLANTDPAAGASAIAGGLCLISTACIIGVLSAIRDILLENLKNTEKIREKLMSPVIDDGDKEPPVDEPEIL